MVTTSRREATQKAEGQGYGRRVLGRAKDALHVESKAAKGARPTRWFLCLPGQEAPDLTPAAELKGAHTPMTP